MQSKLLSIFLLSLLTTITIAQKRQVESLPSWEGETRISNANFTKHALGSQYSQADIVQYLFQTIPFLNAPNNGLEFVQKTESPIGIHYQFRQTYRNIPIYRTQIQVNLDKKGNIGCVTENSYDTSKGDLNALFNGVKKGVKQETILSFANDRQLSPESKPEEMIFFNTENTPIRVLQFTASKSNPATFNEYLIDGLGNIIYERDLHNYSGNHHKAEATTETVPAKVFIPNPTTSASVVYGQGGKYKDNEDADAAELSAELKNVTIDVTFEDNEYKLENDFVKIMEFDNPIVMPVVSTIPEFNFTRSQTGFEDVNAYYHINVYQQYLQSLGFSLVQSQVEVDTHGKNGDDQSLHIFTGSTHRLIFGSGHTVNKHHVDDAEDADVIVHEYGHAISASACSNCNTGTERTSIDEAICDYLATSYKRTINDYNWQKMFSWDGHNEFWDGRNVASSKHYPEDNINDIYYRSEIFSSVLMQIWEAIGKENTDKIVINALYQFTSNISMKTAANILLYVEQQLFQGEYASVMQTLLQQRGLIDYEVNAGPDFTVCLGETLTLGVPNAPSPPEGTKLYWSPGLTLNDSTAVNPIANPDRPTAYTLYLLDVASNIAYTDQAFVQVDYCFDNPPGNDIRLLNTDRFFKRRGNIILEVPPGTEQVTIDIYDAYGRKVKHITNDNDIRLEINGDDFPPGIYIMKVQADDRKEIFKIGRVR